MTWEIVCSAVGEQVRRMKLANGWLYQVELSNTHESEEYGSSLPNVTGWHPPVFVPDGGGE